MTGLPEQDDIPLPHNPDEKRYSENDMQHVFARKQAARDIERLSGEVLGLHKQILEITTTSSLESKALRDMLTSLPATIAEQITRCREEVKMETRDSHPTRLENLEMKNHIEAKIADTDKTLGKQIAALDTKLSSEMAELKADQAKQWLKIVGPITGVIAVAMVVTWVLTAYSKIGGG